MKRIVIMGATSGIGLKVAVRLALKGHKVGVAGRNVDILKQLKKSFPDNIEWEEIDITRDKAPDKMLQLIKRLGGMDTYFHISGVGYENKTLDPVQEIATVQTNCVGFTRMIDTAFTYFRDNRQTGHIAAVTSVAGTRGIGPLASYSASKSFGQTYLEALDQLAHSQGLHIKFTDIRPGWIRTPLLSPLRNYPMTMQLSYAVPRICAALGRCFRVNYVDWRWALVVKAMQAVPNCLWRVLDIPVNTLATPSESVKNERIEQAAAKVPEINRKQS